MPDFKNAPNSIPASAAAPDPNPPTGQGTSDQANSNPVGAGIEAQQPTSPRGPDRRNSVVDRRSGVDRRQASADETGYDGPERRVADRRSNTGLERRRGPGRRRTDERKSAEEGEMTAEQFEFVMAIQTYKKVNKKLYPTWTEVLEVIRQLGYRKVLPREIRLDNVPEPRVFESGEKAA
jgi:hypothetical protein